MLLAQLTLLFAIISLGSLATLHVVSREFAPSWRMVSEYALGKHRWLITSFFSCWAISTLLCCGLMASFANSTIQIVGIIFVAISGTGALLGGIFDVKHTKHGLSFLLGVPTLPIGALLFSYNLPSENHWEELIYLAHATWISLVIMAITMIVMMNGFKKAGIPMGPNEKPPLAVPQGVVAVNGYANRLLILCYIGWLLTIAILYLRS